MDICQFMPYPFATAYKLCVNWEQSIIIYGTDWLLAGFTQINDSLEIELLYRYKHASESSCRISVSVKHEYNKLMLFSLPCFLVVRLVGSSNSGHVQLLYNGIWTSVCSSNLWDLNAARVVCRQLGFTHAASPYQEYSSAGKSKHIYDKRIRCFGNESSIFECVHINNSKQSRPSCGRYGYAVTLCFNGIVNSLIFIFIDTNVLKFLLISYFNN